jgi:hypothetical protein
MEKIKCFFSAWFVWVFLLTIAASVGITFYTGLDEGIKKAIMNDPHKITWVATSLSIAGILLAIYELVVTFREKYAVEQMKKAGYSWDTIPESIENSWLHHHLSRIKIKFFNNGSTEQSELISELTNEADKGVRRLDYYGKLIIGFGLLGTFVGLAGALDYFQASIKQIKNVSAATDFMVKGMGEAYVAVATTLIAIAFGLLLLKTLEHVIDSERDGIISQIESITTMMPLPKKDDEQFSVEDCEIEKFENYQKKQA